SLQVAGSMIPAPAVEEGVLRALRMQLPVTKRTVEFELGNPPVAEILAPHPDVAFILKAQELREKHSGKKLEEELRTLQLPQARPTSSKHIVHMRLEQDRAHVEVGASFDPQRGYIALDASDSDAHATLSHAKSASLIMLDGAGNTTFGPTG